jgi:glycosyltransferase involved in cell wall biosynthesis
MPERTVCFLIANFDGGGAQKQCVQLLNELQHRNDIRLVLVYLHQGEHWPLLRHDRLEAHQIEVSSNFDPRIPFRIARIVNAVEADVLISWMPTSDSYSFCVRALTRRRVKWVMTERNSSYPNRLRIRLRNTVGRHADAIISNSAAGDAYWERRQARGPRFVADNIVTSTWSEREHSFDGVVLHVGRLEPQKDPVFVARAFCELARRRRDLRFAFLGEGTLRPAVERQIEMAGLTDRIAVGGFRPDAPAIIASASVVVSLSHHEGLPNVLLEAAAAGTPIVASQIPEHTELLGETYPYYIRAGEDPTDVAAAIAAALDDPHASAALAAAQVRIARMNPERVAAIYLSVFERVCEGGGETNTPAVPDSGQPAEG